MRSFWLATTLVLLPAHAHAETDARVELRIAPPGKPEQRLRVVLDELLERQPVVVHYERERKIDPRHAVTPRSNATPAVARVWIDLEDPKRTTIYLVDERWERVLIRHVRMRENTEVSREETAHIIASAVEAMLDGAELGVTREQAHRDLGLAQTERRRDSEPTAQQSLANAGAGLFYEAQTWSLEEPLFHGPGLAVYADVGNRIFRPGLWLSGQIRLPVDIDRAPVGVRVQSGDVRLLATIRIELSSKAWFRAGLGGGFDFVDIEPRVAQNAAFKADAARLTLVPIARSMVFVGYALGSHLNVFLALSADLDLVQSRYFVARGDSTDTVFSPYGLRPGALFGVAADILASK